MKHTDIRFGILSFRWTPSKVLWYVVRNDVHLIENCISVTDVTTKEEMIYQFCSFQSELLVYYAYLFAANCLHLNFVPRKLIKNKHV